MKFPTKLRYSLRLLIEIKNSKTPLTLKDASKKTLISENYLKQLAATLEKKGVIKGKKGPNGGYVILSENISLMELVEIFSGGVQLAPCIDENYQCKLVDVCKARRAWHNLNDEIGKLFSKVKLKDF